MNKTDRLLAIVLELQGKGRQRAEDLAATFETSKRTIYRDVLALCEAGVPIISIPGQGYSLMKGYFLPPLSFTTEEATMLLLGSDFMARNFDAQYRLAAESASRKIGSVLPRHYVVMCIIYKATFVLLARQPAPRRARNYNYCAVHFSTATPSVSVTTHAIAAISRISFIHARPIPMVWRICSTPGILLHTATCVRIFAIFASTAWKTWNS